MIKLYQKILIIVTLLVLGFWSFAFFFTENKPIHVPLYVSIDFNNYWPLLIIILFLYWLLFKKLSQKKINLKKIFVLGFSLIIVLNFLKINLPLYHSLTDQNDYYQDAIEITDLSRFLKSFHRRTWFQRLHTRAHPPGPVLFHFFVNQLVPRSVLFNCLIMVSISTLTLIYVYKISKELNTKQPQLLLLLLFSSPGFLLYSGAGMDAVFCFLITAAIYYLLLLKKNFSFINITFASIFSFLASFFTYAAISIPLFVLFYIFLDKFKDKKYILGQVLVAVNIVLIYLLIYWVTGFEPIKKFYAAKDFAFMLMPDIFMTFKRYVFSVSANFVEWLIFLGLPIFSLLILTLTNLFKQRKNRSVFNYFLSILLPTFLINIAGIYKTGRYSGETGRIWLFLTPLIIAGLQIKDKKILKLSAFLSFAQTLIMQTSFNTFW
jgi:hypothetical protein